MPLWIAALTMTATWVDGGYLLGTTEGAYKSSDPARDSGRPLLRHQPDSRRHASSPASCGASDSPRSSIRSRRASARSWAAVLFLPALAGELFWSAELLVAIGSTFGVLLGMKLTTAILLSAVVTTAYTVIGGMWSVAYTDIFQLALVAIGLARRCRSCWAAPVGCSTRGTTYVAARPEGSGSFRRFSRTAASGPASRGRLVGHVADADARRHSVELLFSARAVVPHAACRARAVDPRRRADHRVHRSAAADGRGRRSRTRGRPTSSRGFRRTPAETMPLLFARAVPPVDRPARPGGDCRRGHVELQLVDPLRRIDVQLELSQAPGLADAVGRRR